MRKINKIILHNSDSNISSHDNIKTIKKWHVVENGWSDVGYHYFIQSSGLIERGRDLDVIGAHCKGQNTNSIGICLHGKNIEDFTQSQFNSLARLIESLTFIFTDITTHGHNEFSNKKCPVFDTEIFKTI